jgi:RNA polymerase sigma-70 factor (ECF subfamily)
MDSSSTVIDEGVIDRAVKGDKEAFSVIVRGSGARALLVAERILRSPEEAISAVYCLFVTAFSSLKKLKSKGFLETWLLQILVSVCGERLKEKRGKAREAVVEKIPNPEARGAFGVAATVATSVEHASDRLSQNRTRDRHVRRAVDSLPFKQRAAVMFRDWDGVSTIEVAEILRTSREDVRKLLVNARKTMADMLEASESLCGHAQNIRSDETKIGSAGRSPAKRRNDKKCGKNSERLWLFVGGELGQAEQMDLLPHIEHCPVCRECLARASIALEAIREAAPVEDEPPIAPDKLWKEVEPLLTK